MGAEDEWRDARWLVDSAGHWLELAAAAEGPLTATVDRLRRQLSPRQTQRVLEQVELRRRAADKFRAATRMFFKPLALQQATDEFIANYKAQRFAAGQPIHDLCSGIGGDLGALAARGLATGVERDPVLALFAQTNAHAMASHATSEPSQVTVGAVDALACDLSECDAWHIDPDRRPQGRRTTRVELHEPSAEAIERLLARNPRGAIKLAPAAECPQHWESAAELEWIGRDRECRQLVAWFGSLATQPGQRRATVIGAQGEVLGTLVATPEETYAIADRIERYLFEPHAAVLAAKLGGALAAAHELLAPTAGIAYWTGDKPLDDPLLSGFEVVEVLPLDVKRLKSVLAARGIGRLEIKVRGVDQDPAALRKRLQPRGDESATLLVTRVKQQTCAILANRLERSRPAAALVCPPTNK